MRINNANKKRVQFSGHRVVLKSERAVLFENFHAFKYLKNCKKTQKIASDVFFMTTLYLYGWRKTKKV